MNPSTLRICPSPVQPDKPCVYALSGTIDVHSAEALSVLYDMPPGPVRLDFAQVQRVNSMGLALLLKLFEHSEDRGVAVQIGNASRMVGMLFKMTGMERYLVEDSVKARPPSSVESATPIRAARTPAASARPPVPAATAAPRGKPLFVANIRNARQLDGWYFFNTYLQKRLELDIHMELVHAAWAETSPPESAALVFARPFQAAALGLNGGFAWLARPDDQTDEVCVLARADDKRMRLDDFSGGKIVSEAEESFVYLLGRFLLDEHGTASENFEYAFQGHDIKTVRALLAGEADLAFMQTENYRGLSAPTRARLRLLTASDSGIAFHLFCLHPAYADLRPRLESALLGMDEDDKGKRVLSDLGVARWSAPAPEELALLTLLYRRYVAG